MKKIGKLLITGMLIGAFAVPLAGCVDEDDPFDPNQPGGGKVTINDAYDWNDDKTGSNRPDLGGDYEAQLPPTEAVVTIAESSAVRFRGGQTSYTLPVGEVLTQAHFDVSTLGGHTVAGVGVYNEEGKISGFQKLEDFVPLAAATIAPFFAPENGDAYLYGSNQVGDYYYAADGADLSKNPEYAFTLENVVIDGYMGRKISLANTLTANSYFRTVTTLEREPGQQYTYHYIFKNFGETAISFTVYQMHTGHAWATEENRVASDPVVLQPGESKPVSITVDNTRTDKNTLTLIKLDADIANMSLGVVMARENTTPTQPATITLDLPAGFTVSDDYERNVRTNDKLVLPTASQITNNTGHRLLHWVYADGTKAEAGVRLTGDITLRPVLTETVTVTLDLPDKFEVSDDYVTKYETGDRLVLPTDEQITNNTGNKFIRWVDGEGNVVGNTTVLNGNITIKPELSQTANITVKLPAGLTLSDDYNKKAQTGDKLVVPTANQVKGNIADGRHIAGWYIVGNGNKVITDKTVIEDTQLTIAPYFTRREGTATMCNFTGDDAGLNGKELVFANIQGNGKPHDVYDASGKVITGANANFTAVNRAENSTPINADANGYAELGNILQYNGTLGANFRFRGGARISGATGVIDRYVTHTFFYNFENFGASELDFTIYGLNSGTLYEGEGARVTLKPGESTQVSFTVTYQNAYNNEVNKNAMAYFYIHKEVTDMKLGISMNIVIHSAKVTMDESVEGVTLTENYLNKIRKAGDTLVLPTSSDYVNTTDKEIVGWKDAAGNVLTNETKITGDIELVPVFREFADVTFELPAGMTFNGYEATQRYEVGVDKIVLPTAAQINNTLRPISYWVIKGTTTIVNNDTVVSGAMIIVPVLEPEVKVEVNITAAQVEGFTLSADYLAKKQYKGELFILPAAGDYTDLNASTREVVGWRDKTTGTTLTATTILDVDSIELEPVFKQIVNVSLKLPAGLTLKDSYNTKYYEGDNAIVLPTAEDIDENTTGAGAPLGWYNVANGKILENGAAVTEGLVIAPYWNSAKTGYEYVTVGRGANSGYNTDKMPGDVALHGNATENSSLTYSGMKSGSNNAAQIIEGDLALLGSTLTDTAAVRAGSAIRFDSKNSAGSDFLTADSKVEIIYTVENKGTTELTLSIYQIAKSDEYKAPTYYKYENNYRVEINLQPGQSVTKVGQYSLTKNGNALTYIVFEKDVESFSFGLAMSYKKINEIDDAYKNQAAFVNNVTLDYNAAENGGITVADSYLTQRAGRFLTAPKAADLTMPDGVAVEKWQLATGGQTYDIPTEITDWTSLLLPSAGGTLKAVLAQNATVSYQTSNGVSADGAKTEYKTGEKLELPAVTENTTDGKTHVGWYDTATQKPVNADTVVNENMTLAPYFATGTQLMPLSGANNDSGAGKGNPDNVTDASGAALARDIFSKDENVLIDDEFGIVLRCNTALDKGSAFRFKTSFGVQVKTYKYTIRFKNNGDSELKFTVYQIRGTTDTAGMPGEEITLAAGASASAELTITYTATNTNALTYFVLGSDVAANALNLGITMGVQEVTA